MDRALRLVLEQPLRALEPTSGHRQAESRTEPDGQQHGHRRGARGVAHFHERVVGPLTHPERFEWTLGPEQSIGQGT